jgi:CDP-diacylglycerol--glycerol-3-phosphate 3-phosphatidyltransferase
MRKAFQQLTLANRITVIRILGVPVFIRLILRYLSALNDGLQAPGFRWAALVLFILIAATDALDGYLARSRNEITPLGKMLDPLADKALNLSALILLTRPSIPALSPQFPVELTLLVISRDVILIAGAFLVHHEHGNVHITPRWSGKLATAALMLAIVYILAQGPVRPFAIWVWITGALVSLSAIQYLIDGIRQLEQKKPIDSSS